MTPLDHVIRAPLPWRSEYLTECGRELSDVAAAITADQLAARIAEHGKQRTAFTVCITCWSTASSHRETWETDPIAVLHRETQRAGATLVNPRTDRPGRVTLTAELRAIAALIAKKNTATSSISSSPTWPKRQASIPSGVSEAHTAQQATPFDRTHPLPRRGTAV